MTGPHPSRSDPVRGPGNVPTAGGQTTGQQYEQQSNPSVHQARATAEKAVGEARHKARGLRDEATDAARDIGERIQRSGAQAAEELRETATGAAMNQKSRVADALSHLSHVMSSAADDLHHKNDHHIADCASIAANRLNQLSRYLHGSDWRRLVADAQEFGRRRPEVFFGGMFLAGLGIARFLKASGQREGNREEPWRHEQARTNDESASYVSP